MKIAIYISLADRRLIKEMKIATLRQQYLVVMTRKIIITNSQWYGVFRAQTRMRHGKVFQSIANIFSSIRVIS